MRKLLQFMETRNKSWTSQHLSLQTKLAWNHTVYYVTAKQMDSLFLNQNPKKGKIFLPDSFWPWESVAWQQYKQAAPMAFMWHQAPEQQCFSAAEQMEEQGVCLWYVPEAQNRAGQSRSESDIPANQKASAVLTFISSEVAWSQW